MKLQEYSELSVHLPEVFSVFCGHKADLDWNVGAATLLLSMLIGTKPSMFFVICKRVLYDRCKLKVHSSLGIGVYQNR